ncbi:MAG: hypothetical protein KC561_15755 [Myxococcales bacterium]|nr:hypothetical protein [Myxococcales bacterium]
MHDRIAIGPTELSGPISVELGWLAVVLRQNTVAAVLGPGRYSRWRLFRQGIPPSSLQVLHLRTASFPYSATVSNVEIDDGSVVDLNVSVRVRLRILGDPTAFIEELLAEFGLDFSREAEILIGQLIEESLRGLPGGSRTLAADPRQSRFSAAKRVGPSEVFQITEVLALNVARWDDHQVAVRDTLHELELDEIRQMRAIETEARAGNARAAVCLELSRSLGLDPLYLWDPDAYREDAGARRDALVSLVGQYGQNVALLAEVIGVDGPSLAEVLEPALGASVGQRIGLGGTSAAIAASGSVAGAGGPVVARDAEVAVLAASNPSVVGGVYRQLMLDGDSLRLLILVYEPGGSVDGLRSEAEGLLGEGVSVVLVPSSAASAELAGRIIEEVTGLPGAISWRGGELQWEVPHQLVEMADVGRFLAETVCDVFESPPLVPVA